VCYGRCLEHGFGVEKDLRQAVKLYQQSAKQGNAFGQVSIGLCLRNGTGIGQDLVRGAEFFRQSAVQGNAFGQAWFGRCLYDGERELRRILFVLLNCIISRPNKEMLTHSLPWDFAWNTVE
jgi:TPR repeat protein